MVEERSSIEDQCWSLRVLSIGASSQLKFIVVV